MARCCPSTFLLIILMLRFSPWVWNYLIYPICQKVFNVGIHYVGSSLDYHARTSRKVWVKSWFHMSYTLELRVVSHDLHQVEGNLLCLRWHVSPNSVSVQHESTLERTILLWCCLSACNSDDNSITTVSNFPHPLCLLLWSGQNSSLIFTRNPDLQQFSNAFYQ